ncbi:alpha/beta fold hydrolase [Devriesea agamarum]|uniref:alpha/beta fold hydrolase n=1 Tax=Devriesea agamarum TaxID=472569 RepID=UPI00155ED9BB|nr:alpha/beta fold hydrolase [Devriesea agamarum]
MTDLLSHPTTSLHPLSDGRVLEWTAVGSPHGLPVVYWHGCPGSALEVLVFADAAQRHGLHMICLSRPGFGLSSPIPGLTTSPFTRAVPDALELLDRLGMRRAAMVGYSGGAPYALACAALAPERVAGLALIAPAERVQVPMRQAPRGLSRFALRMLARLSAAPGAGLVMSIRSHLRQRSVPLPMRRVLIASLRHGCAQGGAALLRELDWIDRDEWGVHVNEVAVPSIRLWQGERDQTVDPRATCWLHDALPHSQLSLDLASDHITIVSRHLDEIASYLASLEPSKSQDQPPDRMPRPAPRQPDTYPQPQSQPTAHHRRRTP